MQRLHKIDQIRLSKGILNFYLLSQSALLAINLKQHSSLKNKHLFLQF